MDPKTTFVFTMAIWGTILAINTYQAVKDFLQNKPLDAENHATIALIMLGAVVVTIITYVQYLRGTFNG